MSKDVKELAKFDHKVELDEEVKGYRITLIVKTPDEIHYFMIPSSHVKEINRKILLAEGRGYQPIELIERDFR